MVGDNIVDSKPRLSNNLVWFFIVLSCLSFIFTLGGDEVGSILNITNENNFTYYSNTTYYINNTINLTNNITNNITNNFNVSNSSFQCSSSDKLMNVSIINGLISGVCTADQTGGSSGVSFFDLIDRDYYYRNTDFESVTAGYLDPWVPTAIAGGTSALGIGLVNHPAIATASSGTASNSGYAYQITNPSTYLLGNNYVTVGSFKVGRTGVFFNSSNLTANDTYVRFGFMDIFTVAIVQDGVYFNISHNETSLTDIYVDGVAMNNSIRANTPTKYTILNNTWYTYMIYIRNSTRAEFYIYNESQNLVWNDTVTSRIPTQIGRETSHGLVAWRKGNTTAKMLLIVDYISVGINASIVR